MKVLQEQYCLRIEEREAGDPGCARGSCVPGLRMYLQRPAYGDLVVVEVVALNAGDS